jgi:hypothetical protein
MKKSKWFILTTAILYAILFHRQGAGLNSFLFSLVLIVLLYNSRNGVKPALHWYIAATGVCLSGLAVFYLGTGLPVFANILSIALLSALTFEPEVSVLSACAFSCYTLLTSLWYMAVGLFGWKSETIEYAHRPIWFKPGTGMIVLVIIIPFFYLYRIGNPLFYTFTEKINLDFISVSWLFCFIGGLILMFCVFRFRVIRRLLNLEQAIPNTLSPHASMGSKIRNLFALPQEVNAGMVALGILNILSLLLNFLDCKFLFVDGQLPVGISYSGFVHQGVGSLIFSILIAVALLLFLFRGELNFVSGSKIVRILAYVWIIQNLFMLFTCAYKNGMYIAEFSLTYKRLGVYAWQILALFGLITTGIKLKKLKTNYFLVRINAWLCYVSLVGVSLINWDGMITKYNLQHSSHIDYGYLLSLSYNSLPAVLESCKDVKVAEQYCHNAYSNFQLRELLKFQLTQFLENQAQADWRSFCYSKWKVFKDLKGHSVSIYPFQHISGLNLLYIK